MPGPPSLSITRTQNSEGKFVYNPNRRTKMKAVVFLLFCHILWMIDGTNYDWLLSIVFLQRRFTFISRTRNSNSNGSRMTGRVAEQKTRRDK